MLTKKNILKVILGAVVVLVVFLAYFFFFMGDKKSLDKTGQFFASHNNSSPSSGLPHSLDTSSGQKETKGGEEKETAVISPIEMQARSLVKIFVERYFSYSSDTYRYANLREIKDLATPRFQKEIEKTIAASSSLVRGNDYFSILTKVLSIKVESFDEAQGEAKILVHCQQEEKRGREVTNYHQVVYPSYEVIVKKEGDKWLVDSITKKEQ